VAGKKNKRARAAVATSIVAAASLAGVGTAVAAEPIGGPEVCERCDPNDITVVLSDHVYDTWLSLADDGVFGPLHDVFWKVEDVFIKVEAATPVVDLFFKLEVPVEESGTE
jgi:hypothetical protein